MRCLKRNMTEFEYFPSDGVDTDLNGDGEHTGEYHRQYGTAVSYKGNISTPSGRENQTFYGEDIRYTHTIVMDKPDAEIDEYGIVRWNDDLYDIQAVRRSSNVLSIALRKRTKNNVQEDPGPSGETGMTGETGETGEELAGDGE